MTKHALRTVLAVLVVLASCDDVNGGSATVSGSFDGVDLSGGSVASSASLNGDFLDVVIEISLPDSGYNATIVVESPSGELEGTTLSVGAGGPVSATVRRDSEPERAATGTVRFDALEPYSGGLVAGSYDLAFSGGSMAGEFDTNVR